MNKHINKVKNVDKFKAFSIITQSATLILVGYFGLLNNPQRNEIASLKRNPSYSDPYNNNSVSNSTLQTIQTEIASLKTEINSVETTCRIFSDTSALDKDIENIKIKIDEINSNTRPPSISIRDPMEFQIDSIQGTSDNIYRRVLDMERKINSLDLKFDLYCK